jgi:hypothetical protein
LDSLNAPYPREAPCHLKKATKVTFEGGIGYCGAYMYSIIPPIVKIKIFVQGLGPLWLFGFFKALGLVAQGLFAFHLFSPCPF